MSLRAVDLFAGTGWGVACRMLGIDEVGVENMPEARATREANGMRNWLPDVWDVLENAPTDSPEFQAALLIASPPCQTFSMAGKGAGRAALDEVLALIDSRAYLDVANLRTFGEAHDMRTALVLTPLTYVAQHTPLYVVLEQVPTVLPVWQRMAVELRKWGYSVVTGVLNAEQYGVPQTRKRAILIARADGVEARMPTPTHSRYYPNDKTKLDPDVEPWVSMAEALGWNVDPGEVTVRTSMGAPKVDDRNGSHELDPAVRPMHTVTTKSESVRIMRSNYGTGGDPEARGERREDEPAATVTSKVDRNMVMVSNVKLAHSAVRSVDEPAATITAGHDSSNREWMPEDGAKYFHPMTYGRRGIHPGDEPAPTIRGVQRDMPATYEPHPSEAVIFQGHQKPDSKRTSGEPDAYQTREAELPAPSITSGSRSAQWTHERPSTTVVGQFSPDIISAPGGSGVRSSDVSKHRQDRPDSVRVTLAEAASLQTYPADFDWQPPVPVLRNGVDTGRVAPLSKTKAFLQIGNAVPPLLAAHVLSTILDD